MVSKRHAFLDDVPSKHRHRATTRLHRGTYRLHLPPARKALLKALHEGHILQIGMGPNGVWFGKFSELRPRYRADVRADVAQDVLLAMRFRDAARPLLSLDYDQHEMPGGPLWQLEYPITHVRVVNVPVCIGLSHQGRHRASRLLEDRLVDFYAGDRDPRRLVAT